MMQFRGQLKLADEVLFDDLAVWINVASVTERVQHWRGQFTVPPHSPFEQSGPYRLVLNDGREGDLLIENTGADSDEEMIIQFIGCSPLA